MKIGLVLEGGAMRGMFTAGVLDVLMENDIEFDGIVGTSAGAVFGCNYKSKQIGRTIRYNKKYCRNKEYVSMTSLIKTGNLYGVDFAYNKLPEFLDPFDKQTFQNSPTEFFVVATDLETGKPVYHKCEKGDGPDLEWFRASASMPLASTIVEIGNRKFLDGGISNSVALEFLEKMGYERNVVILTQPRDYVKKPNKALPLIKIAYRKYPKFVEAVRVRHNMYNKQRKYIFGQEKEGKAYVVTPESMLNIGAATKNPEELERVYQLGRETAQKELKKLIEWMENNKNETHNKE